MLSIREFSVYNNNNNNVHLCRWIEMSWFRWSLTEESGNTRRKQRLDGGDGTANLLFGCAASKKALVHNFQRGRKKKKLVYGLPIKCFWSRLCVRCVETSRFPKHGWSAQLGEEIKDFKEFFGGFFWKTGHRKTNKWQNVFCFRKSDQIDSTVFFFHFLKD